jgi:thymidylate synthase
MSTAPHTIEDLNLSEAWVAALHKVIDTGKSEISPLVLTLTDFTEVNYIRKALDTDLVRHKLPSIDTVSETIFPQSLYEYSGYQKDELYERYKRNLPRIKKIDSSNSNGTYFERLVAFEGNGKTVNQLDIIIDSLLKNTIKRRSKLQAAIFDPTKDHSPKPFQGFPCLQHVTFYKSDTGGLILNSFYAIQYLYRRAYGNWLGLINLGRFVAKETGLELERFNCFIGVEHLDHLKKSEAKKLLSDLNQKVKEAFV